MAANEGGSPALGNLRPQLKIAGRETDQAAELAQEIAGDLERRGTGAAGSKQDRQQLGVREGFRTTAQQPLARMLIVGQTSSLGGRSRPFPVAVSHALRLDCGEPSLPLCEATAEVGLRYSGGGPRLSPAQ